MNANLLKAAFDRLSANNDLVSIKSDLYTICSAFGRVRRLDVVQASQGDKRQALCFLRMHRTEHEQQVMRFLDIARFASEPIIVVDLPHKIAHEQRDDSSFGDRRCMVREVGTQRRLVPESSRN